MIEKNNQLLAKNIEVKRRTADSYFAGQTHCTT